MGCCFFFVFFFWKLLHNHGHGARYKCFFESILLFSVTGAHLYTTLFVFFLLTETCFLMSLSFFLFACRIKYESSTGVMDSERCDVVGLGIREWISERRDVVSTLNITTSLFLSLTFWYLMFPLQTRLVESVMDKRPCSHDQRCMNPAPLVQRATLVSRIKGAVIGRHPCNHDVPYSIYGPTLKTILKGIS